jgi:hypothetical protein
MLRAPSVPSTRTSTGRKTRLLLSTNARVARLLALAYDIEARIEAGEFHDYADVARAHGLTRARLTQVMNLLLLAPPIQEEIFHLEFLPGREPISERDLRRVLRSLVWDEQVAAWRGTLEPSSRKGRRLELSGRTGDRRSSTGGRPGWLSAWGWHTARAGLAAWGFAIVVPPGLPAKREVL